MAQHDYNLANDTGQNFRNDANAALSAIVSQNSGTTEPTTTFAYQIWVDTTLNLIKIRNGANTAWIVIGDVTATNLGLLSLAGGTLTGALLVLAGSLSSPGVAFSGDSDTGVYSPAANQLSLVAGGTEMLRADLATYLQFLGTAAVKMPIGTTAQRPTGTAGLMRYNSDTGKFEGYASSTWKDVGGGGGGAGFTWRELSGTSPTPTEEFGEEVYNFGAGLAQELYASIKVPQSYSGGVQINLYISAYSPSAASTILLQAQSTLIEKSTDAFNSTTNQRTTTNAALTNTVANQLREFALDLTDSTGKINGVSVAAGDVIKVRLYRGTDTDTADLRMIPNATDIKLS